jgi:TPP-dependent pyruvate/acetoin dehydrogenase alpha subunit
VHAAARRAVAHARAGHGPYLLECKTFRMTGHSAHDPADYVPKHLFTEWEAKDPIRRLLDRMLDAGWTDRDEVSGFYAELREEVDEAIRWAEASPFPDPRTLTDNVYEQ